MTPGFVSVIIPTFNRPNYLPLAVESVLAQTYPQIELIIVDDGSLHEGAETKKALSPYLCTPHVTYVYHENRGIGATVNRGLAMAAGEYIQRLDDDDRLLPEKIAQSVKVFSANPSVGLVATGYYLIDENGKRYQALKPRRCPNPARLLNMLMHCVSAQAAVMVRASVHQKVGLYHNGLSGEDYIMWLKIAREFEVATLDEPLAEYRRHPGNTTVPIHQPKLEREMMGFLVEMVSETPLSVLIPGLESKAHGHALRAAVFLVRDREHFRTTALAKGALKSALELAPKDPLLSLWKGVLAVYGDGSLQPFPWQESLPEVYQKKAAALAGFFIERKRLLAANIHPSSPKLIDFRQRFGRFRKELIAETFQRALGTEGHEMEVVGWLDGIVVS
jgi:hypothetical protein